MKIEDRNADSIARLAACMDDKSVRRARILAVVVLILFLFAGLVTLLR